MSTRPSRSGVLKNNKHIDKQTGAKRPQSGAKRPVSGRNVQVAKRTGAKRPGGETSKGRNVQGAKRPGGETSRGRNVQGAKRPVKGRNVQGAKRQRGETSCYPAKQSAGDWRKYRILLGIGIWCTHPDIRYHRNPNPV